MKSSVYAPKLDALGKLKTEILENIQEIGEISRLKKNSKNRFKK